MTPHTNPAGNLTRAGLEDRIGYCQRELQALQRIQGDMGCRTCWSFDGSACKTYGPVPPEFVAKGCDDWEFNDCPF